MSKIDKLLEFAAKMVVSSVAVLIAAYLLKGVHVDTITTALIVALCLALFNTFLRPLLIILTIPITIFTFGLFLLAINAFIILIISRFIDGFTVDGFWWAFFFSIILSITTSVLEYIQNIAYGKKKH